MPGAWLGLGTQRRPQSDLALVALVGNGMDTELDAWHTVRARSVKAAALMIIVLLCYFSPLGKETDEQ